MRPGENRRSYPDAAMSRRKATAALSMLLAGCTDERLAGFTAAGLASSYNVTLASAERMLDAARRGRGG